MFFTIWVATWQNQQNECAPSEDSDQPGRAKTEISLGICPVWSVFAVRMKKAWVLSYPLSAQWRLWSDWADRRVLMELKVQKPYLIDRLIFNALRNAEMWKLEEDTTCTVHWHQRFSPAIMKVSRLLCDGRGFLLSITFQRLEVVQWNFAGRVLTDCRVLWENLKETENFDQKLSEKSTYLLYVCYVKLP